MKPMIKSKALPDIAWLCSAVADFRFLQNIKPNFSHQPGKKNKSKSLLSGQENIFLPTFKNLKTVLQKGPAIRPNIVTKTNIFLTGKTSACPAHIRQMIYFLNHIFATFFPKIAHTQINILHQFNAIHQPKAGDLRDFKIADLVTSTQQQSRHKSKQANIHVCIYYIQAYILS